MPRLGALAQGGVLYQVGQTITGDAATPVSFVLFNNMNSGLPIFLYSARVNVDTAMAITAGTVAADPALTAGNKAANLNVGDRDAQATFEAAEAAAVTFRRNLAAYFAGANSGPVDLVAPGTIVIPRSTGIVITAAAVAGNISLTMLWAEPDEGFEASLYDE